MSEEQREKIYWWILVIALVCSPLLVLRIYNSGFKPSFNPIVFAVVMFASIPLTLLAEILINMARGDFSFSKIWLVRPAVRKNYRLSGNRDTCTEGIYQRLTGFGFQVSVVDEAPQTRVIYFKKFKPPATSSFIEHGFFGAIRLADSIPGVEARSEITFDDTILFETGEIRQLTALCDYISLRAGEFSSRSVTLTLYCGIILAVAAFVVGLLSPRYPSLAEHLLVQTSAGAAGMIAMSVLLMLKNRKDLFGYRLVFCGLLLSIIPLATLAVRTLMPQF